MVLGLVMGMLGLPNAVSEEGDIVECLGEKGASCPWDDTTCNAPNFATFPSAIDFLIGDSRIGGVNTAPYGGNKGAFLNVEGFRNDVMGPPAGVTYAVLTGYASGDVVCAFENCNAPIEAAFQFARTHTEPGTVDMLYDIWSEHKPSC